MKEGCPLGGQKVWDSDIPPACRDCIDKAVNTSSDAWTDLFKKDCRHEFDFGGESLQPITGGRTVYGPRRLYGVLELCSKTGEEALADMIEFECPREKNI